MRHALAAIALMFGAAGCGGSGDGETGVRTTAAGTQIVGATDARTGLHFEVQTSSLARSSGASVRTTEATPQRVRRDLEGKQLALSCKVRGAKAEYFPGFWDDTDKPFGTALLVEGDASAAESVTSCMLMRAEPGPRPGTAAFSNDPADAYSLVRFP